MASPRAGARGEVWLYPYFLSPLPQAVPQAAGFSSRSLPRLNRFFNDMIKTSLCGVCRS